VIPVGVRDQDVPDRSIELERPPADCGHFLRRDRRVDDERLPLRDHK
jgi:hypothetical protein